MRLISSEFFSDPIARFIWSSIRDELDPRSAVKEAANPNNLDAEPASFETAFAECVNAIVNVGKTWPADVSEALKQAKLALRGFDALTAISPHDVIEVQGFRAVKLAMEALGNIETHLSSTIGLRDQLPNFALTNLNFRLATIAAEVALRLDSALTGEPELVRARWDLAQLLDTNVDPDPNALHDRPGNWKNRTDKIDTSDFPSLKIKIEDLRVKLLELEALQIGGGAKGSIPQKLREITTAVEGMLSIVNGRDRRYAELKSAISSTLVDVALKGPAAVSGSPRVGSGVSSSGFRPPPPPPSGPPLHPPGEADPPVDPPHGIGGGPDHGR